MIAVPIYANHQMNGFIGVDNPDLRHNEISITLLSDVGGHLGCMRENLKSTVLLKKALDEATKRSEIIAAIATLYVIIVQANVKERTYELLKGHDLVQKILGQKGKIDDVMERLPTAFAAQEEREKYREFLDFDTLTERLRNTNFVSNEFVNINGEWRVSRFIVKSRDTQGNVVDVLYVVRDITEEKLRELMYQKQLKASMEDAQRANISKTAFLQRMSHDIRTPINGIKGMIEISRYYAGDEEKQEECRQKIVSASSFLLDLVNNVLDMNKLESGQVRLEQKPFDLLELFRETVSLVEVQAVECQVDFQVDVCKGVHWNVLGSPLHLRQILQNIMSNAIKYNRENGWVRVSLDADHKFFYVKVSDSGIGIPQESIDYIFERFYRVDKSHSREIGGTGLGLAITRSAVVAHRGAIKVQSTVDEGTTFIVRIPLRYIV